MKNTIFLQKYENKFALLQQCSLLASILPCL